MHPVGQNSRFYFREMIMRRQHHRHTWPVLMCIVSAAMTVVAHAAYKDEIGYTLLQSELGASIPDGTGVRVTQVESENPTTGAFQPNPAKFSGKTITHRDNGPIVSGPFSSHANSVGLQFYGVNSLASGVPNIASYSAIDWLQWGFLGAYTALGKPLVGSHRIGNHS